MKITETEIGGAPAVLYGDGAEKAYLFVHGLFGNKYEAERFARGARWTKTDSALYGAYWRLWLAIRPLRRLVLGGTRRVLRMLGIAKEARGGCRRK